MNFLSDEQPTVVITLDYSVRRSEGRYETASGSIERPLDASEVQNLKGNVRLLSGFLHNYFQNIYKVKLKRILIQQAIQLQ